ncbi:unnamed protein product [Closterium sp. NIES-65]|nr:unnamed protein product [Closterium sp. NIES-65]CAI5990350.1 unnamed protein product [Closterium sp. NIES-65]
MPPPAARVGHKQAVVSLPRSSRFPSLPILLLLALGTVLLARWPVLRGHVAGDSRVDAVDLIMVGQSWASNEDEIYKLDKENHGVAGISGADGKGGEPIERIEWARKESGWAEEEGELLGNGEDLDSRRDSGEAERVGELSQEGKGEMAKGENGDDEGSAERGGREAGRRTREGRRRGTTREEGGRELTGQGGARSDDTAEEGSADAKMRGNDQGSAVRFTPLQGFLEEAEKWHAGLGGRNVGGDGGEAEGAGSGAEGEGGGAGGKAAEEGSLRFPVRVVTGRVRTRRLVGDDDTALIVRAVNYGFAACEFSPFHSKPRHEVRVWGLAWGELELITALLRANSVRSNRSRATSNHSASQHQLELPVLAFQVPHSLFLPFLSHSLFVPSTLSPPLPPLPQQKDHPIASNHSTIRHRPLLLALPRTYPIASNHSTSQHRPELLALPFQLTPSHSPFPHFPSSPPSPFLQKDHPIQSNHSAIQHRPELLALAAEMGGAMGGGDYDAVHVRRGDKLNPNMWPHLDRDTRPPA